MLPIGIRMARLCHLVIVLRHYAAATMARLCHLVRVLRHYAAATLARLCHLVRVLRHYTAATLARLCHLVRVLRHSRLPALHLSSARELLVLLSPLPFPRAGGGLAGCLRGPEGSLTTTRSSRGWARFSLEQLLDLVTW